MSRPAPLWAKFVVAVIMLPIFMVLGAVWLTFWMTYITLFILVIFPLQLLTGGGDRMTKRDRDA